ncbi:MAG TPA: hypothetical protein DDW23_02600 [Planctomycetes bacterium]|nr:hypothetical protein [Planctomycetota bacterium]
MKKAWSRLEGASQDPAITLLVLFPLALVHLTGRGAVPSAAYSLVENVLLAFGGGSTLVLGMLLFFAALWALGRIHSLALPWRAGAVFSILEGILWGILLHPALAWLTSALSDGRSLSWGQRDDLGGSLALAAGAGLYEELLFRAFLFGWVFTAIKFLLRLFGWGNAASGPAWVVGLLVSSCLFSLAHGWGDPSQLDAPVLLFRFLAGVLLGLLYSWRGLAVVAYAHASYNALILL